MRSDNRERLLAVERILTGANKPMTIQQIIDELERRFDMTANRKAIMGDISAITRWLPIAHVPKGYIMKNKIKNF